VFAKNSSHLKLAIKYDSGNLVYDDVVGQGGVKLKASILYPKDPRRRLEVLWNNEQARTDLAVVAINGRSQWSAPGGLKLGLTIAAIEKANGGPFKLSGFGSDGTASITSWEGGSLGKLAGGCKAGVTLSLDRRSPEGARGNVSSANELMSNDNNLKAVKPTISEILIGY